MKEYHLEESQLIIGKSVIDSMLNIKDGNCDKTETPMKFLGEDFVLEVRMG